MRSRLPKMRSWRAPKDCIIINHIRTRRQIIHTEMAKWSKISCFSIHCFPPQFIFLTMPRSNHWLCKFVPLSLIILIIILKKGHLQIGCETLDTTNWNTSFLISGDCHLTTYVHDPVLETWPIQIKAFQFANHPKEMTAQEMQEHMLVSDLALPCLNCILL